MLAAAASAKTGRGQTPLLNLVTELFAPGDFLVIRTPREHSLVEGFKLHSNVAKVVGLDKLKTALRESSPELLVAKEGGCADGEAIATVFWT
jgi:hypothetical protein